MGFDVVLHVAEGSKRLRASRHLTLVWSLPEMSSLVSPQIPFLCERSLADLALVRFFTGVRPLVDAEPALSSIGYPADIANERLFASVHEQVHIQVTHRFEGFVAAFKRAKVVAPAYVSPDVRLQYLDATELLQALYEGAKPLRVGGAVASQHPVVSLVQLHCVLASHLICDLYLVTSLIDFDG